MPTTTRQSETDNKVKPKPFCFVVGPIDVIGSDVRKKSDMLLNALVKYVLEDEEFGYEVRRGDEDPRPGMINDRIIHDITRADLVIADLTGHNPNVFYELGIRHATELPTIHIAVAGTSLPFDNAGHDTILIDITDWNSIVRGRERLASTIREILKLDYKVSNPITQANASFRLKNSGDSTDRVLADLRERMLSVEKIVTQPAESKSNFSSSSAAELWQLELFGKLVSNAKRNKLNEIDLLKEINSAAKQSNLKIHSINNSKGGFIIDIDSYVIKLNAEGSMILTSKNLRDD